MEFYTSLKSIQEKLNNQQLSCRSLVAHYLTKIEEKKHLNAFLEVYADEALNRAKALDEKIKQKTAGKLAGMVIGIKDNICYQNHKISAASKILEGFESVYSATVVERLLDEDAIIIGRLNCDEFAMGSANENSAFGAVKNPINTNKVPGGSSGGSAAAVKAGLCLAALGSDTGGSIRQPASFCDVVGFKPTYGRVSRYGLIAYASSFDQIGPLTNCIEDAAVIMEVIAGKDEYDATLSNKEVPQYSALLENNKSNKIAYFNSYVEHQYLDAEIKNHFFNTIDILKSQGNTVTPVDFPYIDFMVPCYYVLTTAEASSNLSRYDGIHYGYRSTNATDLESTYVKSRSEGFGKEVKRRIMLGTYVLSAGYYDAYYTKAQKVRRVLSEKTKEILSEYDFIITPTTPHTAFNLNEEVKNPVEMYLEDIFTVQANLTGMPAVSIPIGKHSNGLSYGLQIMGKAFHEADLLAFAYELLTKFKKAGV